MKIIIGLIAMLFIATGVFGQAFINDYSFIETTPTGNNTIEDVIRSWNITDGNYDRIDYIHFVQNDRLYLLSYEPKENPRSYGSRNIYFYSKDIHDINSPWKKASVVIMTNSYGTHCYDEVDFFRADKSRGSFGKVVIKDDCIEITIGWSVMNNVINDCVKSELKYEFVADDSGYLYSFTRIQ